MSKDFSNLLSGALANKQADELSIRERIIIREDFKDLIPQLKSEELNQLEENILLEGVRDPLIIWPVNDGFVLVDGHNRFSICQKHKLDFPFRKVEFKSDDDARDWMIKNQLGRRNLTLEEQSHLRGLRYNAEKLQGKRSDLTSGQNDQKLSTETTAEALGKEYGVSPKTIVRDGEFAKGIEVIAKKNPELKKQVLKGETKISKSEIQKLAKNPEKIDEVINKGSEKVMTEPKQVKLSAREVSEIAFEYIMKETRPPQSVYYHLGRDHTNIDTLEFFQVWNESMKAERARENESRNQ
ncbi:MAG: hypothetical protein JSS79_10245 [Bacteroidetes bacterium]|nr:hypothetical protein [Bacteroidota bacterium]